MGLQRRDVAKLFKETAFQYLIETKPVYSKGHFPLSEKELQKRFAITLMDKNLPFRRERYFPDSKTQKGDFQLFDDLAMQIEIEWEAKLT